MEKKKESTNFEMVAIESLPEDLQMIAETLSIEVALRLSENFGGMRIYIPKIEHVLRSNRNKQIRKEFNGANHRPLAKKYKLTETWIRDIVKKPAKQTLRTDIK